uniref:Gag protein n=2 Tax=Pyricularia TaxID=48558 RepID=Q9C436_PYRGI|nr:Gag protein [Pyricularia grisea]
MAKNDAERQPTAQLGRQEVESDHGRPETGPPRAERQRQQPTVRTRAQRRPSTRERVGNIVTVRGEDETTDSREDTDEPVRLDDWDQRVLPSIDIDGPTRKTNEAPLSEEEHQMIVDELEDRIAHMQDQIDLLNNTKQENEATISRLLREARSRRETTAISIGTGSGGSHHKSRVKDPPTFSNNPDKDEVTFEVWHRRIENKLLLDGAHYPTDADKRAYVESRLGGDAADTLLPYLNDTHPDQITTYDGIMGHLREEYKDTKLEDTARDELDKLIMSTKDKFMIFKNKFVKLAGQSGLPKRSWKRELHRRLPTNLRVAMVIYHQDTNVSFDAYVRTADGISYDLTKAYASRTEDKNKTKTTSIKKTTGGSVIPRAGGPARTTGGAVDEGQKGKLSVEEMRGLIRTGKCFQCREPGHISRNCPNGDTGRPTISEDRVNQIIASYHGKGTDMFGEDVVMSEN